MFTPYARTSIDMRFVSQHHLVFEREQRPTLVVYTLH